MFEYSHSTFGQAACIPQTNRSLCSALSVSRRATLRSMRDLRPPLRPGFPRPSMFAGRFGGGGGDGGGGSLRWPSFDSEEGGPPWTLFLVAAAGTAAAQPWVRRGIRFWLGVGPILASYALLLLQASLQGQSVAVRQERLAAHHERCAPRALRLVQHLAGGYIKMGQVLSNRADVLPLPYVLCFGVLQDQVPPRAWSKMERQLHRDAPALCREMRSIDPVPLGAASTGQVHRVTLRDGRDCAVKLQYVEAQRQFGADFANVARLARLALPALVPVVKEVRRRFQSEFDYEREAVDMMLIRDALRPFRRSVVVPRAYPVRHPAPPRRAPPPPAPLRPALRASSRSASMHTHHLCLAPQPEVYHACIYIISPGARLAPRARDGISPGREDDELGAAARRRRARGERLRVGARPRARPAAAARGPAADATAGAARCAGAVATAAADAQHAGNLGQGQGVRDLPGRCLQRRPTPRQCAADAVWPVWPHRLWSGERGRCR